MIANPRSERDMSRATRNTLCVAIFLGSAFLVIVGCTDGTQIAGLNSKPEDKAASSPRPDVVTLEVLGDGIFVWNGERITGETLDRYMKAAAAQQPQPEIRLKPSPEAKNDSMARALEGAQRNGVMKFGFVGTSQPTTSDHKK